jgi:hypothetical protein
MTTEQNATPPQCDRDKLLTIIAYAYQIAGAHDVPAHILDVLSDPEGATSDQVEAMLPYMAQQPKLTLALPVFEKRRIVIVSDEMLDDERLVCVAIEGHQAPPTPGGCTPLPWRITDATEKKSREIVGANGSTVAKLTALDIQNAELIVAAINSIAAPQPE